MSTHPDPGNVTAGEIASQPAMWPEAVKAGTAAAWLHQLLASGTTLYTGFSRGIAKGLNPDTPTGVPAYILI